MERHEEYLPSAALQDASDARARTRTAVGPPMSRWVIVWSVVQYPAIGLPFALRSQWGMVPMVLVGIAYVVTVSWWAVVDQRRGVKKRSGYDFRRAPGVSTLLLAFQVSFLVVLVLVGWNMMTWSPWQVMLLTTGYGLITLVLLLVYNTKAGPPRQQQQQQATLSAAAEDDAL